MYNIVFKSKVKLKIISLSSYPKIKPCSFIHTYSQLLVYRPL
jgi:hypothetical protein